MLMGWYWWEGGGVYLAVGFCFCGGARPGELSDVARL